jgi:hypothetical protein
MKYAAFILICLSLLPYANQVNAQEPVPSVQEISTDAQPDKDVPFYFAGATEDDKAFIKAAREAVKKSNLNRLQKWRIERRLNNKRFVKTLKAEVTAEVIWQSDDPEAMLARGIDWSDVDWQAIVTVALMLIKLCT